MRMNLELKPKIIGTFKKIISQMKKALMPQQSVYMILNNQFITLLTEYDSKNLRNCIEYFTLASSVLESKQEMNKIVYKILDFNVFAQNVNGLSDQNCTVNLFLSKENENRYIKLKCTESDSLVTQSRTEIKLNFSKLPFPEIEQKIFGMNIKSRDLSKLLEISSTNQCDLEMSFNIRSEGSTGEGTIYFKLKSPSIKIIYDNVKVYDVDESSSQQNQSQSQQNDDKHCVQNILFKISQIHAKQLSHICSIDEQMSICILKDGSLGIEFWEAEGPDNESTIIAMKHFIVPKLDDLEYEDANRMDVEQDYDEYSNDVKVEDEQGHKKKNRMYSDSEEDENDGDDQ